MEREVKESREEFQEFQEGSRELEAELETQLEQVIDMFQLCKLLSELWISEICHLDCRIGKYY